MCALATKVFCRSFGASARRYAKPGYFLHKFIDREKEYLKRMKMWENREHPIARTVPQNNTRRQSVLNSLYMDTITDILGSEFASELEQYRIQIHNVRILKSLEVINVYWSCDESGMINVEAADVLKSLEPKIRRELGAVRHMGTIPRVNFVFYAGLSQANAVHSILHQLRQSGELDDVEPAPIPVKEYPQVYGLDRNKILGILARRSLPADFLEAGGSSSAEDFVKQFRKSKFADKRLKTHGSTKDPLWRETAETLLSENNHWDDEHFVDDQYDDEATYFDEDEPLERLREHDEDFFDDDDDDEQLER